MLNMTSAIDERDLTARASIRNAERGPDAVTMREIAAAAGVSPALVVHHFGSKDGLRAAVDDYAARAFDALFEMDEHDLGQMLTGGNTASIAELFVRSFPQGSPLPAYLRRLLLSNDPAGAALFGRWYAATRRLIEAMTALGVATPSEDLPVRAAFLLVSDLALVLLRDQITSAIGIDPLTPEGIARWAKDITAVYTQGAFAAPAKEATP
jgi:AcrR family transcriptional regulator